MEAPAWPLWWHPTDPNRPRHGLLVGRRPLLLPSEGTPEYRGRHRAPELEPAS